MIMELCKSINFCRGHTEDQIVEACVVSSFKAYELDHVAWVLQSTDAGYKEACEADKACSKKVYRAVKRVKAHEEARKAQDKKDREEFLAKAYEEGK